MQRSGLNKWEILLITVAILLLGGAGFVYFTGFPIGKYILGLTEGESAKQVATLSRSSGTVRRQKQGDSDFQSVNTGSALFDEDTVVTSPSSTDRIEFPDGSYIQMAPSTMIRLSFGANVTLGGVVRTTSVEVVSGNVTGESKSSNFSIKNNGRPVALQAPRPSPKPNPSLRPTPVPSPSPSPSPSPVNARFESIFPKSQAHLAVQTGSPVAEVPITFSWKLTPPEPTVIFSLVQRWPKVQVIFTKSIAMKASLARLPLALKRPGNYRWAVGSRKNPNKIYGYTDFTVDPWYQAIRLKAPLVGGLPAEDSQLRGKVISNYDIDFSWEPYGGLKNYELSLFLQPYDRKPIWSSSVAGTSYEMNQGSVFTGKTYFQVVGRMPNGFVVISPRMEFSFDFLPPVPETPKAGTALSKRALLKEDNTILFTWQKTNFTRDYGIEIATDPQFTSTVVKTRAAENFYVLKDPKVGTYYWRVRSFSDNGKASAASAPAPLTVGP